jgi:hypothetical protein
VHVRDFRNQRHQRILGNRGDKWIFGDRGNFRI